MSDREIDSLIDAVGRKVYWTAFDLIQNDPHQWSTRGCQTCSAITTIIGRPFGCVLYAKNIKPQSGL